MRPGFVRREWGEADAANALLIRGASMRPGFVRREWADVFAAPFPRRTRFNEARLCTPGMGTRANLRAADLTRALQ